MEPDGRPNSRPYPDTKSHVKILNKILEQFPVLLHLLIIFLLKF